MWDRATAGRSAPFAVVDLDAFEALCDPADRDVLLTGKDCRGIAHKIVEIDAPTPSLISAGSPPENGVWHPQTVHAVAAAKALAYERETPVELSFDQVTKQ